jgi:hypothetical protein
VVSELELAGVAELSVVADLTVMVLSSLLLNPGRGSSMGLVLPGKRRAIDYPGGNVRKIVREFRRTPFMELFLGRGTIAAIPKRN